MQQGSVVLSTSLLKVMGISLSDDFSLTAILCWLQQGIPLLRWMGNYNEWMNKKGNWFWYPLQHLVCPFPLLKGFWCITCSISHQSCIFFGLPQTLTSAPSRERVTTPASTTPAALSAYATRDTSCMASLTVEVRVCSHLSKCWEHGRNMWNCPKTGKSIKLKCVWQSRYNFC